MNYDNHNLIDHLAAEYVLGTLKGPARKRFARLLMTSDYARHATNQWEIHTKPSPEPRIVNGRNVMRVEHLQKEAD